MSKTTILSILGFGMAGLGLLSLILMLFGAKFSFLRWLDFNGPLFGFVLKLGLSMAGFLFIFLSRVDWDKEIDDLKKD